MANDGSEDAGRVMLFFAAREKSRGGSREPSRWMWCSHFGRAARRGCRGELHMVVVMGVLDARCSLEVRV